VQKVLCQTSRSDRTGGDILTPYKDWETKTVIAAPVGRTVGTVLHMIADQGSEEATKNDLVLEKALKAMVLAIMIMSAICTDGGEFESLPAQDFWDISKRRPHTVPTLSKYRWELFRIVSIPLQAHGTLCRADETVSWA
jgi:hypothetical protein